jgi:hypothetical protein
MLQYETAFTLPRLRLRLRGPSSLQRYPEALRFDIQLYIDVGI